MWRQHNVNQQVEWVKNHRGFIHEALWFRSSQVQGEEHISVIAQHDLPAGTLLLIIPSTLGLDISNSRISQQVETWAKNFQNQSELTIPIKRIELILVFIYEYENKETSFWKPYFDSLPSPLHIREALPIFWSETAVSGLQGTVLGSSLQQDRNQIHADFHQVVLPFIQQHPDQFRANSLDHWIEIFDYAYGCVLSRSFGAQPDDSSSEDSESTQEEMSDSSSDGWEENAVCLPLVDFFNGLPEGLESAQLEFEPNRISLLTSRAVNAQQEIFISYGTKTNGDLLNIYGFTIESCVNRYYEALLDVSNLLKSRTVELGAQYIPRIQFLVANQFLDIDSPTFVLSTQLNPGSRIDSDTFDDDKLLFVLKVLFMDPSEFSELISGNIIFSDQDLPCSNLLSVNLKLHDLVEASRDRLLTISSAGISSNASLLEQRQFAISQLVVDDEIFFLNLLDEFIDLRWVPLVRM